MSSNQQASSRHPHHQQQQHQHQQNRYAHIGPKPATALSPLAPRSSGFPSTNAPTTTTTIKKSVVISTPPPSSQQATKQSQNPNQRQLNSNSNSNNNNNNKFTINQHVTNSNSNNNHNEQHRYYGPSYSFQNVDWREQWHELRAKFMDKVHEPQSQRRIILVIVCCALLLDNMLYMVIVPIIPDYLRSIGAWSTYAEGAKYVRRNTSGTYRWERIGGTIVYEGEESAVGFLFASKAMIQLLINPFSGAIIDRIGYEMPMMIGLVVMFFSTIVFACGQTYSILFLARSLQGVGSAFADTAGLAMIADRFTEDNERQRALGIALAFISFGCLVAPPFGAVLYQTAGKEVPFIILSLVCLVDGFLLLLVTQPGTFASFGLSLFQSLAGQPSSSQTGAGPVQNRPASGHQMGPAPVTTTTTTTAITAPTTATAATTTTPTTTTTTTATASGVQQKRSALQRQKSTSRRQSLTAASNGQTITGTPIYVLLKDPYIACCSGALIMANVSLAFLEPTISIWMQDTMPDIEEWQMGMIWLPAFIPHVLGVYCTVRLADKYPKYQWLIAAIGLALEGVSSFLVPFCSSFWSLIIPISGICFGIALVDTAILPTLGYLVDTRYVSVYGSIYAIADISYSLSYAIGPIIAGGIVEAIGFTSLNILIAITNLGYTPVLMMLKHIHDYKPFEDTSTGNSNNNNNNNNNNNSIDYSDDNVERGQLEDSGGKSRGLIMGNSYDQEAKSYSSAHMNQDIGDYHYQQQQQQQQQQQHKGKHKSSLIRRDYHNPRWASTGQQQQQQQVMGEDGQHSGGGGFKQQHSVTIVEDPSQRQSIKRQHSVSKTNLSPKNLDNDCHELADRHYQQYEDPWRDDDDKGNNNMTNATNSYNNYYNGNNDNSDNNDQNNRPYD